MHTPARDFYGLGLLWRFIQADYMPNNKTSVDLTESAVALLVRLMGESECQSER